MPMHISDFPTLRAQFVGEASSGLTSTYIGNKANAVDGFAGRACSNQNRAGGFTFQAPQDFVRLQQPTRAIFTAGKIAGHARLETTVKHYIGADEEMIRQVAERLNAAAHAIEKIEEVSAAVS